MEYSEGSVGVRRWEPVDSTFDSLKEGESSVLMFHADFDVGFGAALDVRRLRRLSSSLCVASVDAPKLAVILLLCRERRAPSLDRLLTPRARLSVRPMPLADSRTSLAASFNSAMLALRLFAVRAPRESASGSRSFRVLAPEDFVVLANEPFFFIECFRGGHRTPPSRARASRTFSASMRDHSPGAGSTLTSRAKRSL